MKKVHVNVGTIGHIDHGKTTLTAAILAVHTHRNKPLARSCVNPVRIVGEMRQPTALCRRDVHGCTTGSRVACSFRRLCCRRERNCSDGAPVLAWPVRSTSPTRW